MNKFMAFMLVVLSIALLNAENEDLGTTGFNFLKINYSTRAAAMGSAYMGVANDADALFYNPAGILNATNDEVSTSYINYFEGFSGGSVAYIKELDSAVRQTRIGAFIQYMGTSDMDRTLVDASGQYIGKDGTFGASDIVFGVSGAVFVNDVLNLGVNVKYLAESIDDKSASAVAADLSIIHQTNNPHLRLGAAIRNIGTQLSYFTDSEYDEGLPTLINAGLGYSPSDKFTAALDLYRPLTGDISIKGGLEYKVHQLMVLRAGYKSNATDWKTGDNDLFAGMSAGFGIKWKKYKIDYAVSSYGDLGAVNQISLRYIF